MSRKEVNFELVKFDGELSLTMIAIRSLVVKVSSDLSLEVSSSELLEIVLEELNG